MPNQITELYNELRLKQSISEYYKRYLDAMEKLNDEITALMEPDENGWKMLDNERMNRLAQLYKMAGAQAEIYLYHTRETKDPAEQQLQEKVRALQAIMAADTAAFRHYNPKSPEELKSLPTILEESRIPVMDQGSKQIKSVGGAQSSRIPMTIIGPDGQPMPGMFTKAEVFDPLGDINRVFSAAAKKAAANGKGLLDGFMASYRDYYIQNPDKDHPVESNPVMVLNLLKRCRKPNAKDTDFSMSQDNVARELGKVYGMTPEAFKAAVGKDGMKALSVGMERIFFDVNIKTDEVKMSDQTRIDRKNAGMSTVAELLGIRDVVCYARPMKLKGPDGKIVDGTFMAMAKGEDPMAPGRMGHYLDFDGLKHSDGRALESIADLQVLDYICGNIDRHGYNLFYRADTDGFFGVQGIDNDSSFGQIIKQKGKTRRMPLLNTMGVISKKTAEQVMNLSTAELSFSLRGLIDDKAIDAACKRLYSLQMQIEASRKKLDPTKQDIKYPYIRELETGDFAKVDMKTLTSKAANNHFREIKRAMSQISSAAKVANEGKEAPRQIGSDNRATEAGVYGQMLKAKEYRKLLSDRTSFWRGSSSDNYIDIDKALKDYQTQMEKLQKRMQTSKEQLKNGSQSPKDQVEQYVTRFDLENMKQSLLKVKAAADKYAQEKRAELAGKHKSLDDDSYVKARIEAAEEISRFANDSQTLSQDEKEFLASNERRSLEQIARTASTARNNAVQNNIVQNNSVQSEGPVRNSGS